MKTISKLLSVLKIVFIVILAAFAALVTIFLIPFFMHNYYETTDIAEYGHYVGNHNNREPTKFITSFFPEQIKDTYENVTYSYKAVNMDTYSYEAYLEFTIADTDQFLSYVEAIAPAFEWREFAYGEGYLEYVIADEFELTDHENHHEDAVVPAYHIEFSEIGKILVEPETQTVIYVAIGVLDGGFVHCGFLSTYFSRFNIDPIDYEEYLLDS